MKRMPVIKSVMTPFPHAVDIDAPIVEAQAFMREHHIRHLPVTEKHKLVGILTDRDIKLYLGPELAYPKTGETRVRDVYLDHPYIVDLNERLDTVLQNMADRHIGSVLVTRNGKLAGVFTATDVCRCFAEYLRDPFRPPGGDDAA
ncbi:MAG: CBS domain-containing protein [Gammaproteobacteria bacterium]|nr:CBS domain-containing protein [Gammaproteobacteria bacterium]